MSHNHKEEDSKSKLIIGSVLNLILAIAQIIIGFTTNSLAIVSDSIDSVSDAITCLMPIIFNINKGCGCGPNKNDESGLNDETKLKMILLDIGLSYGMILARLVIFSEALTGLIKGDTTDYGVLTIIVGALGIIINVVIAIILRKESKALLFCLLNDLVGSILTLILSILSLFYNWDYNLSDKVITIILTTLFIIISGSMIGEGYNLLKNENYKNKPNIVLVMATLDSDQDNKHNATNNVVCVDPDLTICKEHTTIKVDDLKICNLLEMSRYIRQLDNNE